MKLEIRLDKDDTYSVVDVYFSPTLCDPSGLSPTPKVLVGGLTKEEARTILQTTEYFQNLGYGQAFRETRRWAEEKGRS